MSAAFFSHHGGFYLIGLLLILGRIWKKTFNIMLVLSALILCIQAGSYAVLDTLENIQKIK